jgi:peptidoglycan/xylan/chitin deacetylase (PgdA/CDA1 family)
MVSTNYLREVYEKTVGSPREQSDGVDWQKFENRLEEFRSMLSGRTLSRTPKRPIMNELLKQIEEESWRTCQKEGLPWIQKWYYPGKNEFAVFLSHDVDEIKWSWRRKLLMGLKHPSTLRDGKNHYWGFDEIMKLEERLGFRSTFFFVSKNRHKRDPPYSIEDVADICARLKKGNWEVGLHGSYSSFNNKEFLDEERRILQGVVGGDVFGVRQHYANFDPAVTFNIQKAVGFAYDSTICSNEVSGFASGICHPYGFEGLSLLELPPIAMDGQLFWYEKMDRDEAFREVLKLLDIVREYNGLLTLDWHQRSFDRYSFPGWAEVYMEILKHLKSLNVFASTGTGIVDWWKRREDVRFERRVVGKKSVEWHLSAGSSVEDFTLRVRIPEDAKFKKPDVRTKAKFSIEEDNNEIWIRFDAIPEGERIGIMMSK